MELFNHLNRFLARNAMSSAKFHIKIKGSCVLTEFVEQDDHVFKSTPGHTLATLNASGVEFSLLFVPVKLEAPVSPAKLELHSNANTVSITDLPELTQHANYRQVTKLDEYKKLIRSMRLAAGHTKGVHFPYWALTLLFFAGCLLAIANIGSKQIMAEKAAGGQASSNAAPYAAAGAPKIVLSEGDQLNAVEKAALAQVVGQSGIELSQGGKSFVVFSDPNCSACRELEGRLASMDKALSPIIVPVSFKPQSPEAVAGVLCSKDVLAAWRSAVAGGPAAPSCDKGVSQAVANNAAFAALRFDKTPTFVTASGKVAVGVKDFEGLTRWLKENSGG